MRNKHIYNLLDSKPFNEMTVEERQQIQLHIKDCERCCLSYQAAKLSHILLTSQQAVEPSPFFHTRVMAAIRQRSEETVYSLFSRLWQAAAPLVFAMMAFTVFLAALSLTLSSSSETASLNANFVSTEMVIMDERLSKEITNEEALQIVYAGDSQAKR
ncbi:MAG: hypothetical protein N2Z23_09825 [Pyrinomonadaceae bacterium]|nr:hypothetical protein [Pyrinomonadaceae bacterium]MCX7640721.1 hypothetical protein [Pyrinomonadaceae bacterium]MDW8305311.1 hypothetical protein [Acidobacteriota bacterium]